MGYGLHPCSNRLKSSQSEQVEGCRSQRRHRSGIVAPVAMVVLVQLGVTDPVPAFNAPAVVHQLQQGFWAGAQAGEKQIGGLEDPAVANAGGDHFHEPAGAAPGLTDVLRRLFGAVRPGDGTTMTLLENTYFNRDVAFPLELASNLAMLGFLVPLDGQEEVGPLLLELLKNGFWVWSGSAWLMATPKAAESRVTWAMNAEPPPGVDSIEPRSVLPLHTS